MVTDYHSHMLPAMDDGSPDIETSIKMLSASASQKVDNVILSSHYYHSHENIESFTERRDDALSALRNSLTPDLPKVYAGAEVYYFPGMSREDLTPLCINGSRVILLELPFDSWTGTETEDIGVMALDKGYHIILAHVERYAGDPQNMETIERLSELPITMQVNAGGFCGLFPNRISKKLLGSGYAQIIGSDSHNLTSRAPNIEKGRKGIKRIFGDEMLKAIDQVSDEIMEEIEAGR